MSTVYTRQSLWLPPLCWFLDCVYSPSTPPSNFPSLCSRYPWLSVASSLPLTRTCALTSSTVVIRRMRGRLKCSLFFFLFAPCRFSVSTPLIHSFGAEWRGNHVEAATAAIASVGGFHGSQTADRIKATTSQEHSVPTAPSCGQ